MPGDCICSAIFTKIDSKIEVEASGMERMRQCVLQNTRAASAANHEQKPNKFQVLLRVVVFNPGRTEELRHFST